LILQLDERFGEVLESKLFQCSRNDRKVAGDLWMHFHGNVLCRRQPLRFGKQVLLAALDVDLRQSNMAQRLLAANGLDGDITGWVAQRG